jgi:hypothetical protein
LPRCFSAALPMTHKNLSAGEPKKCSTAMIPC